ncbi:MAG: hypothetical protein C0404_07640 [Verrucomicrobia bacterium]|nr:hypothetical protein [Verrucomicrobiota bacterium]
MSDNIQIPGFEIIEKIGAGGMAAVWKARQISLDRIVAIKIMNAQLALDPSDRQRFQAEAQAAAKLKHPGIVQVYDASVEQGMYFFVMEYVAGYTVGDWVRRKRSLSEKDALLVADCVADALEYAWNTARIIHCDIKPDNIMIDADGTVKVADLGLARTINAMAFAEEFTDEVLGTPAYISPEQATGAMDLDFRADIYSLGAMLYHLVTGKLMFSGEPDDKVLELQVSGQVEDPIDINSHLTKGMCTMLEKMLAKKKEDRYASWEAVRADISKVKKKIPLVGIQIPDGASSIKKSTKRMQAVSAGPATKHMDAQPHGKLSPKVMMGAAAALGVIFLIWLVVTLNNRRPPPELPRNVVTRPTGQTIAVRPPSGGESGDQRAQQLLESARSFAAQNPEKYDEAIKKFEQVRTEAKGTKYVALAIDEIRKVNTLKGAQAEKVVQELREAAEKLAAEKKFTEAASVYENYSGPYVAETSGKRLMLGGEMRNRQKTLDDEARKEKEELESRFKELLDKVVAQLLSVGPGPACALVSDSMSEPKFSSRNSELESLRRVLSDAANMDRKIMESFKVHKGEEVAVAMAQGQRKYTIIEVRDGKVTARQKIGDSGSVVVSFEAKDLSATERLQRMGPDDLQDTALVRGLMALNQKALGHAKRYFAATHPLISGRLVAKVESMEVRSSADEAKAALAAVMRNLNIPVDAYDRRTWIDAVEKKKFTKDMDQKVADSVADFRNQYAKSDFGEEAESILKAIESGMAKEKAGVVVAGPVVPQPPQPPVEPLPGLPALKPISLPPKIAEAAGDKTAVAQLLLDRNSELASTDIVIRDASKGRGVRAEIFSPDLIDILPVAALKDLKEFACGSVSPSGSYATEPRCRLMDIAALRGLPLEYLYLGLTSVSDLTSIQGLPIREMLLPGSDISDLKPVRGMPLEKLSLRNTKVKDLTPIKGMRIKELDLGNTKIYDFSPLNGMPLERLDLSGTQVKDITFVKDMPLRDLHLGHTKINNLAPIKNMSLSYLNLEYTTTRDLSALKDLKLDTLCLTSTEVTDITPLKGMQLSYISLSSTLVKDFTTLKGMPLKNANLSNSKFDDLSIFKDSALHSLDVANTRVQDLTPIAEIPLRSLSISGSPVRDLRPLANMPLVSFNCANCPGLDLSPLRRTSIEDIYLDLKPSDEGTMRVLRSMPKLRSVNGKLMARHGMELRPEERQPRR